ncbi:capsular polysaccharide biosynthesis protein [uncultured Helicobacter sp.]|uniref:capsular polysaccharide biosynthesis protein n=1 Tax=uncultured Helicobacter sp. TaxID=175537 RepID=UPI00260F426E|nr:capsular polysaccharide biosynthesis protein [uncultured Helicobacter sp.]
MVFYSTSRQLIANVRNFFCVILYKGYEKIQKNDIFLGWGRKKSGLKAIELAKKNNSNFLLLEDGFLRSLDLGVEDSPSFSIVKDTVGIYYDATSESELERILNTYEFDDELLAEANLAIKQIKQKRLSKYNNNLSIPKDYFTEGEDRILVIAQVANDASLKYGLADSFSTLDLINDAIRENPTSRIYIKMHPDVLSGKKRSDIDIDAIPKECVLLKENYNPIELLGYFKKVYTKTSGMGFEALMMGCECVCYGLPFYAGWGLTQDKLSCNRRMKKRTLEEVFAASYILYSEYFNPYLEKKSNIFDAINTLARYKKIEQNNSGNLYFFGFTLWKRWFMRPFFKAKNNKFFFLNSLKDLKKYHFAQMDKFFIWGKKFAKEDLIGALQKLGVCNPEVYFVEDGFLRSVSLGSDLTRPFSLIVDSKGLYVDPNLPNDLEDILQNYDFDDELIERAKFLRDNIVHHKFSKYNGLQHKDLKIDTDKKIILIPAQVEDDVSMLLGGMGYTTLSLLQEVREKNPDAYILYKPHPDVLSGNRKGLNDKKIILKYCDFILENVSIDSAILVCDEVHTITSTSGFDALLREKKVFAYGLPFYAGWGLTQDKYRIIRRTRILSIEELVAGVLIVYPRYVHPKNKNLCEVEVAFDTMLKIQRDYFSKIHVRVFVDFRTFVLRKIRRVLEFVVKNGSKEKIKTIF